MNVIRIRDVVMEDTVNYHKLSMLVAMGRCDWKCCYRDGSFRPEICQNSEIGKAPEKLIDIDWMCRSYKCNPLTSAMVVGGLDPINDMSGLLTLCRVFRSVSDDDIVIYTGYTEDEIPLQIDKLKQFSTQSHGDTSNLIVKFGRFVVDSTPVRDAILGVDLASSNQYAKYIFN